MIYFPSGLPGMGKSYYCTNLAVRALRKGKYVLSNYPIIDPLTGKKTHEWKPEYMNFPGAIKNAIIIIDEAYKDLNSHSYADFTPTQHEFFATCRHTNIDLYLIAQNPKRLLLAVREISGSFIHLKKFGLPGRPIGFRARFYETMEDYETRTQRHGGNMYRHEWIWFNKTIAMAYDTHQYANKQVEPIKTKEWGVERNVSNRRRDSIFVLFGNWWDRLNLFIKSYIFTKLRGFKVFEMIPGYNKNASLKSDLEWLYRQMKQILKRLVWEVKHVKSFIN